MANGKWRAQTRKPGGGSASQALDTKAEARKWAAWAKTEMAKGEVVLLSGPCWRQNRVDFRFAHAVSFSPFQLVSQASFGVDPLWLE